MIEDTCRKNLLAIARAFAKAEKIRLTQVSRRVYGTSNFLAKFERGTISVSLEKYDKMLVWFMDRWPEDVRWPWLGSVRVSRPAPKRIAGKVSQPTTQEARIA